MPTFILAGFQRSLRSHLEKAVKAGAGRFGDWTPVLMQGDEDKRSSITRKFARKIIEKAAAHDGAHVFGVESRDPDFVDVIRENFRFRRVTAAAVGKTGAGDFEPLIQELLAAFVEEQYWIDNIKPQDYGSPLILPRIFHAQANLAAMWDQAESYNNMPNLEAAAQLVKSFAGAHRQKVEGFKKNPWVCKRDWVWQDDGDRHGTPVFPDDWKYSYQLDDGFHYDVSSKNKTKTSFSDRAGKGHPLPKGYLNVTAQGWVRGDKPAE